MYFGECCVENMLMLDKNLPIQHSQYRGADVLATQGARTSATMILTMSMRNNSVPAHLELTNQKASVES